MQRGLTPGIAQYLYLPSLSIAIVVYDDPSTPGDGISPRTWYQALSKAPGFIPDAAQAAAVDELEALWRQLVDFKSRRSHLLGRTLFSPEVPKGLYFWGGVGRGKSFLMDAFYACVPYHRKRRVHFHDFMAEAHQEMKRLADTPDPLLAHADSLAKATRLLCFDEFHVSDIADAMILGRLLEALFERGVVLMMTSNYPPDGLYPNGLQRQNFLPAIALIKRELNVLRVDGGHDYRLRAMVREPVFMVPDNEQTEAGMRAMFLRLCSGALEKENASLDVLGRSVAIRMLAHGMAWFDFGELCGKPRAQPDYLDIAHRFHTVFISHVPRMSLDDMAEAQRFTWLVDVYYDTRVKLIISAQTPAQALYDDSLRHGDFLRTVSRLVEMQSRDYLALPHSPSDTTRNPHLPGAAGERRAALKQPPSGSH